MDTSRVDGVRLHIDAGTDGREVLVLPLLREATPLDVGEVLFFPVGGAPRLHDGLGVRRGGVAGGAAHLCWSCSRESCVLVLVAARGGLRASPGRKVFCGPVGRSALDL